MAATPSTPAPSWPSPRLLLLWLAGAVVFAILAGFASANDRFPVDLWVSHRIQDTDFAPFSYAMDWAEDLSDAPDTTKIIGGSVVECEDIPADVPGCIFVALTTPNVVPVFLAALAILLITRRRREAPLLLSTVSVLIANAVWERVVRRPSPPEELVTVTIDPGDFAFPSGHVAGAVVFYGLLFYYATVFIRQPLLRGTIQAACLYFISFTAMERLYAGVHWFSDVYGGLLHGLLWLVPLIWFHRHRILDRAQGGRETNSELTERTA